jgi:sensor histidine kinase YesM
MNYRFAGEVKLKTDIPDEVWSYPILRFLLQPLVENAIYHGLNSHNGGEITITAVERPNEIAVYIIDNGEGMSEQKLLEVKASILKPVNEEYQEGIGLRNVNRRLQLHYGDRHQLQIQSEWKVRTELMLTLPKVKKS